MVNTNTNDEVDLPHDPKYSLLIYMIIMKIKHNNLSRLYRILIYLHPEMYLFYQPYEKH